MLKGKLMPKYQANVVAALKSILADTISYKYFANADDIHTLVKDSDEGGDHPKDSLFKIDEDGTPGSLMLEYGAGHEGVGNVAYVNGEPVGWAVMGFDPDDLNRRHSQEIIVLVQRFVKPEYRNRGIANELTKRTVKEFLKKDLAFDTVEGLPKNLNNLIPKK